MDVRTIATATHGRVLVELAAARQAPVPWLFAFHGYGQCADDVLGEVLRIPGITGWHVAAVQALHRFYARRDERVVASWMTRQDREQAIADNVEYVDRVVQELWPGGVPLVYLGFSQGAAMAYRAAMLGRRKAAGVIALGGDVPPEFKTAKDGRDDQPLAPRSWPPVLIGAGREDPWYTPAKCDEDEHVLRTKTATLQVVRFQGGHEWTAEFRDAAGVWLSEVAGR